MYVCVESFLHWMSSEHVNSSIRGLLLCAQEILTCAWRKGIFTELSVVLFRNPIGEEVVDNLVHEMMLFWISSILATRWSDAIHVRFQLFKHSRRHLFGSDALLWRHGYWITMWRSLLGVNLVQKRHFRLNLSFLFAEFVLQCFEFLISHVRGLLLLIKRCSLRNLSSDSWVLLGSTSAFGETFTPTPAFTQAFALALAFALAFVYFCWFSVLLLSGVVCHMDAFDWSFVSMLQTCHARLCQSHCIRLSVFRSGLRLGNLRVIWLCCSFVILLFIIWMSAAITFQASDSIVSFLFDVDVNIGRTCHFLMRDWTWLHRGWHDHAHGVAVRFFQLGKVKLRHLHLAWWIQLIWVLLFWQRLNLFSCHEM